MNGFSRQYGQLMSWKWERFFLPVIMGLLFGLFVLMIFRFPQKFTYYFIAGPVILFIAIVSGNFKRFFQATLIFIIPINFATHFFRREYEFGGGGGLSLSPLDIVLILLYGIWLYELLIKHSSSIDFFPKITVPVICFAGIGLLSMIPAQDPYIAFFEVINIVKSVLLFIYVGNHFRTKRDILFVLILLLSALFIQCLIAFAQRWLGMTLGLQMFGEYTEMTTFTLDYYMRTARVGGTIGHPNGLAKYIELLIPIAMVLLVTRIKLKYKLASAVVFVSAFIVLLLTLSRGGWVCFAGSIGLALVLIFRAKLISLQTLVAIGLIVLLMGGVGLSFSNMVQSRLFGDDYGAAEGRMPLNRIALNVIRHYPLLGVGLKNYGKVMDLYNPNLQEMQTNMVHNAYLLKAAEVGIPGLIVFLWLLMAIFTRGLKNLKGKSIFVESLNIGFLSGIAAYWAHWLVDPGYLSKQSVFWVLVGLIVATGQLREPEESPLGWGSSNLPRPEERVWGKDG